MDNKPNKLVVVVMTVLVVVEVPIMPVDVNDDAVVVDDDERPCWLRVLWWREVT